MNRLALDGYCSSKINQRANTLNLIAHKTRPSIFYQPSISDSSSNASSNVSKAITTAAVIGGLTSLASTFLSKKSSADSTSNKKDATSTLSDMQSAANSYDAAEIQKAINDGVKTQTDLTKKIGVENSTAQQADSQAQSIARQMNEIGGDSGTDGQIGECTKAIKAADDDLSKYSQGNEDSAIAQLQKPADGEDDTAYNQQVNQIKTEYQGKRDAATQTKKEQEAKKADLEAQYKKLKADKEAKEAERDKAKQSAKDLGTQNDNITSLLSSLRNRLIAVKSQPK